MMKKLLVSVLAIVLVTGVSLPTASAEWGGSHGRGGWDHRGGGCVGCAILGGLVLGGILGGALAAPYYSAPPPVYAPPPPTCYTQPGHWEQVPAYTAPNGYTTYRNVWVPAQTVCQ